MSDRAVATFDLDSFDQHPLDEGESAKLARGRVTKTFHGDIEGHGVVEMLTAVAAVEGSAGYVAIEWITASVKGRTGSFVLQHSALMDRGDQTGSWTIVPDTGTGELEGIRGSGIITIDDKGGHHFTLDYDLIPL